MPLETRLLQIIGLLYRMNADDEVALAKELTLARQRAWTLTIRNEARRLGCDKTPQKATGTQLRDLESMSLEDAKSIARTWNRDVEREIGRLFETNRRGNRYYYAKNVEAWAARRAVWKDAQIALNTEQSTIRYAKEQFWKQNKLLGVRFVASGPAAVCKVCIRIFAAGVVDYRYTQRHPLPAHINCPHTYETLTLEKRACAEIWVG
jgi:hypothetical protein